MALSGSFLVEQLWQTTHDLKVLNLIPRREKYFCCDHMLDRPHKKLGEEAYSMSGLVHP